jgi:hypothetical protein
MRRVCRLVHPHLLFPIDKLFHVTNDQESRAILKGKEGCSEVKFMAENGKTYHGMLYQPRKLNPAPLVIYFGGNAEVSYQRLRILSPNGITSRVGTSFLLIARATG